MYSIYMDGRVVGKNMRHDIAKSIAKHISKTFGCLVLITKEED